MPVFASQPRFALTIFAASMLMAFSASVAAQDAAAPAVAATASKPDAAAPKPFKEIIKDAKEMKGFFNLYQKDEKVWIEIKPDQINKPFFFSYNIPNSVGERGLYGSQMGGSHMAVFKKIGNQVQLIARNTRYTAAPGTPQADAVAQAFSDSLLGSAVVASAPHPDTKSILVEANGLLLSDIPGYSTRLEYAYRMPFTLDARNTSFVRVRTDDSISGFHVNAHFSVPKISPHPLVPAAVANPPPPVTTPDPRSLFIGFYYSFAMLPVDAMAARQADDRIGHFVTTHVDFTEDLAPKTSTHYVNRWRLEKSEPGQALSEPKQAIVYWLDKNIPKKYRKSIAEGVLEWNKAFEKIGFKNALVVKQQTDKDEFDTLDARHASIRWFVGADVGFAIGPSQVDPRSGEILDADIGMSDVFARGARRMLAEDAGATVQAGLNSPFMRHDCDYAGDAANEMDFALGLLEARGEFEMDSPQAEALAQSYVKDVIMHEIGHTLGLRHNFRSSTIYSLKQLQDPQFTKQNGMAGSVMDYIPFNLAVKGETQGEYVMSTLGPYDYWAIEYAYKPFDSASEKSELSKIMARSTEPQLIYGTDEDASSLSDPAVNVFDLGSDPLAYFRKRLTMTRELWDRLQVKQLKPGDSYETLRRSFEYGFNQFSRAVTPAVKFVGGVTFLRDHAGTGQATFTPVPVQRQREALTMLTDSLFASGSFKLTPELASRLGVDHFDRGHRTDVSVASRVLGLQAAALDQLMADAVAARLLDSQEKLADAKQLLSLGELYDTLQSAIWSELKSGKEINAMRRNLQREHLKRIANALVKAAPATPADARSLQRANAVALQENIRKALTKPMSREAKAHLAESLNTLSEALKAPMQRASA